jgi:putative ABC transport system permease protein
MIDSLFKDLQYSLRTLLKRPGFATVAVLTIALGIGANTAIFSVIDAVLLRPLPYPDSGQLVVAWGDRNEVKHYAAVSYPDFVDWQSQTQTLEHVAAFNSASALLREGDGEPQPLIGANVSADLFPLLRITPASGRPFTRSEDQPDAPSVVLLGHSLWQQRFNGDPQLVGKQIRLGSRTPTVVGILPEGFRFPAHATKTEFLFPLAVALGERAQKRGIYSLRVVARLKPGVSAALAQNEMRTIGTRLEEQHPDEGFRLGAQLIPLHRAMTWSVKTPLLVLLGAVGLVLLIACANVANLLLARASARQREIAIRSALGAGRLRVVRQLLTESLLLGVVGGTLGLLLAIWGVQLLLAASPLDIPRLNNTGLDLNVLLFTAGVSLLTSVIFGLVPALQASKVDTQDALKDGGRGGTNAAGNRVRSILVVSEVALSLVLLVGAGLLAKSFLLLREVNPGFSPEHVLITDLSLARTKFPEPQQQQAAFAEIVQRVSEIPGVDAAAVVNPLPLGGRITSGTFFIAGRPPVRPEDKPLSNYRMVSNDYFRALGITVVRGRTFDEHDTQKSPPVIIVNETFARRYFGDEEVLGQHILIEGEGGEDTTPPAREIIGVVGDVRHQSLDADSGPEYYLPYTQAPEPFMTLVVRASSLDPAGFASSVKQTIKQWDRDQYVAPMKRMTELVSESVARRQFNTVLTGLFALLALLLASIGIFGVMSYMVMQRTKEIGVRIALGAQTRDVIGLVVGQAMKLILAGVALGLAAAFALTRVLSSMLFGVAPTDPLTFVAVSLLLIVFALVACLLPARRASGVDPLVALRYE